MPSPPRQFFKPFGLTEVPLFFSTYSLNDLYSESFAKIRAIRRIMDPMPSPQEEIIVPSQERGKKYSLARSETKLGEEGQNVLHKVPFNADGELVRSAWKTDHSQVASNDASEI